MSEMESQAQRPIQGRPRAKSAFSISSDKSKHSKKSSKGFNGPLTETHDEKQHLSSTTKANPNAAITELQPVAAALEKSTMGSLRGGTFNDYFGNPITDPDLSNPTRHRNERPLQTIMSFEAMIDKEYNRKRRESIMFRPETSGGAEYDTNYSSRRTSAYWGNEHTGMNGSRVSNNNTGPYYSQRGGGRDSYYEAPQYNNPRRFGPRQHSDPALSRYNNGGNGVYPQPTYGQSSATVNTGGSNGSASDQWHPSTDPSSENSSIDRMAKADGYDPQQAHREPISEEGHYTYGNGPANGYNPGYMGAPGASGLPPAPPPKNGLPAPAPRQVIKLSAGESGASSGAPIPLGSSSGNVRSPPAEEKRGSWLKRRFSKKG